MPGFFAKRLRDVRGDGGHQTSKPSQSFLERRAACLSQLGLHALPGTHACCCGQPRPHCSRPLPTPLHHTEPRNRHGVRRHSPHPGHVFPRKTPGRAATCNPESFFPKRCTFGESESTRNQTSGWWLAGVCHQRCRMAPIEAHLAAQLTAAEECHHVRENSLSKPHTSATPHHPLAKPQTISAGPRSRGNADHARTGPTLHTVPRLDRLWAIAKTACASPFTASHTHAAARQDGPHRADPCGSSHRSTRTLAPQRATGFGGNPMLVDSSTHYILRVEPAECSPATCS